MARSRSFSKESQFTNTILKFVSRNPGKVILAMFIFTAAIFVLYIQLGECRRVRGREGLSTEVLRGGYNKRSMLGGPCSSEKDCAYKPASCEHGKCYIACRENQSRSGWKCLPKQPPGGPCHTDIDCLNKDSKCVNGKCS